MKYRASGLPEQANGEAYILDVVHDGGRRAGDRRRGHGATIRPARAPSYLVCRRGVYFFQIRVPDGLVPCGVMPPIRVRLGRLPRREAQRLALRLHVDAADAFAQRRWQMRQQNEQAESETGNVGSEQWIAGMQDMLAAGLARLQNPTPPFHPTPSDRRTQAAFQEILSIEHQIKKGPTCNPVIAERADLLRKDVWDRWRDGEGIAPAATDPLTQAISKLTDVADRQLSLLAPVASPTTIHQLAAAPALEVDRSTASEEPRDPPSATLAQMVSTAPLFSQLVDEYLAMRASACAEPGAVSTMRLRAGIFLAVMGDPPLDRYIPKDLQDYVNLLQYLPVEYTREERPQEFRRSPPH